MKRLEKFVKLNRIVFWGNIYIQYMNDTLKFNKHESILIQWPDLHKEWIIIDFETLIIPRWLWE